MYNHSEQLRLGPYRLNRVVHGDCLKLTSDLPDESIDVIVTSPPYWGQRMTQGNGTEPDPQEYLRFLTEVFTKLRLKLKSKGLLWINLGDAYNTPVNWRLEDHKFSSLGPDKAGLPQENSAYVKPRAKRKPFIDKGTPWLQYGNLLALPYRLVLALCNVGYLYRGEVIWKKRIPCPKDVVDVRIAGMNPFICSLDQKNIISESPPLSRVSGNSQMRRSTASLTFLDFPLNYLVAA